MFKDGSFIFLVIENKYPKNPVFQIKISYKIMLNTQIALKVFKQNTFDRLVQLIFISMNSVCIYAQLKYKINIKGGFYDVILVDNKFIIAGS